MFIFRNHSNNWKTTYKQWSIKIDLLTKEMKENTSVTEKWTDISPILVLRKILKFLLL